MQKNREGLKSHWGNGEGAGFVHQPRQKNLASSEAECTTLQRAS
jgi:hypothetical protein